MIWPDIDRIDARKNDKYADHREDLTVFSRNVNAPYDEINFFSTLLVA